MGGIFHAIYVWVFGPEAPIAPVREIQKELPLVLHQDASKRDVYFDSLDSWLKIVKNNTLSNDVHSSINSDIRKEAYNGVSKQDIRPI